MVNVVKSGKEMTSKIATWRTFIVTLIFDLIVTSIECHKKQKSTFFPDKFIVLWNIYKPYHTSVAVF